MPSPVDYIIRLVQGATARNPATALRPDGTLAIGVDKAYREGDNQDGVVVVAAGVADDIVAFTPGALWDVEGFLISGNGSGDAALVIAGVTYPCRINQYSPWALVELPRPHQVAAASPIVLSVTADSNNRGPATFRGIILGRPTA